MNNNKRSLRYPFLEKLSTEDLEDIIRADLEGPDLDYTLVSEASHILSMRRCNGDGESETDAAWDRFQKLYNTSDGRDKSLYDISDELAELEDEFDMPEKTQKPKKQNWRRIAAAAVAVLVLALTVVPPTVGAVSIFTIIGQWTDEIFSFGSNHSTSQPTLNNTQEAATYSHEGLEQFAAAVKGAGINIEVVPKWLPEEYKFVNIESYVETDEAILTAIFEANGKQLLISISNPAKFYLYEKDESSVEEYRVNGVTHFFMKNMDRNQVVWRVGEVECCINGSLNIEEMQKVIDSIYLGEISK